MAGALPQQFIQILGKHGARQDQIAAGLVGFPVQVLLYVRKEPNDLDGSLG